MKPFDKYFSFSRKKRQTYGEDQLQKALLDVKDNSMSISQASQLHGIPRTTLSDKLKNNQTTKGIPGPSRILTEQEELDLLFYIITCTKRGFVLRCKDICETVKFCLDRVGRTSRFQNNLPGKKWCQNFLKKYKDFVKLSNCKYSSTASVTVTEFAVRNWFK